MQARLKAIEIAPEISQQAVRLQQAIEAAGVDKPLIELIKIRASQINGCAYCLHMHTRDALAHGETDVRIFLLSAWRESTLFSARERAVLDFTEALTHVAERGAPTALYAELKRHFTDLEVVGLCSAIAMINYWNRIAISFGMVSPREIDLPTGGSASVDG
jgi:AhpD family alkylhydroperoxidase